MRVLRVQRPVPDIASLIRATLAELVAAIGCEAQELPLHRVDLGDIGSNEMIAAPFAGHHLKVTACVSGGRTSAAEMDKGSQVLLLLRVWLHIAREGENRRHMAIEIHGCKFDGMARERAEIEAGEPAAGIRDGIVSGTEPRGLGGGRGRG